MRILAFCGAMWALFLALAAVVNVLTGWPSTPLAAALFGGAAAVAGFLAAAVIANWAER